MENQNEIITPICDTEITDSIIASIIEKSAKQTLGFFEFSQRFYDEVVDGITEKFGAKRTPGVTIKKSKAGIEINIYVIATLDRNLIEFGNDLKEKIYINLIQDIQLTPCKINVNIEGIKTSFQGDI